LSDPDLTIPVPVVGHIKLKFGKPTRLELTMDPETHTEEMVTITKAEYDVLKQDQFKLDCLERGGVDNWEWYGEALNEYFEKYNKEDNNEEK